ncbi:Na+/H+ antiporter [Hymenobacter busanensis]|uniref:Na+/H+ antiporter n=1 Tax=Hymenobacter busanensis TaxID=2607656 RepID=A0A7L4ZZ92_9BACT|nr:Na+/H+ antiporter [Hymenobacter busanensis]KAA9331682.1 Na+/H+ antiporter [Hymenobacter busanensis]QHJ08834.1 Na+/H+ antiporter [Hymenobacter busanensis]
MQSQLFEFVCLVLIILALVMLAGKLRVAYPIVLVLGGLGFSFTAQFANIVIEPEVVFFLFLPPLLYEAAWQTSWKEFWRWRRVIISFAFPIVVLTSCVVAVVSHWLIPGFTLALGFLLGGIISPPDAISATTIMRQVQVPKPLVSIIEGESLLNDASSLVVFRFALAAVLTGQFHAGEAALSFVLVIVLGTLIGLLVGLVFYAIHRWLPTTPSIEVVLTVVTPYCMYYAAEYFHYSGVLAVVAGGLLLSNQRHILLSYRSRIEGVNVWTVLSFVLNGLVFLLIGLQLPVITRQLGGISLGSAIGYGLLISLVLVVTRLLCAFGAAQFTRLASHFITVAVANPGWRGPTVIGWAGMRGVVSLAAALSIPLLTPAGQPFPYRNLILFVTFVVILVTLVFQGLTLPWLIRKLQPDEFPNTLPEAYQERLIRQTLARQALEFVAAQTGPNRYLQNLHTRLQLDLTAYEQAPAGRKQHTENELRQFQLLYADLLARQRSRLHELNRRAELDEELIRKHLALLDLEELKLQEKQLPAAGTP